MNRVFYNILTRCAFVETFLLIYSTVYLKHVHKLNIYISDYFMKDDGGLMNFLVDDEEGGGWTPFHHHTFIIKLKQTIIILLVI